MSRSQGKIRRDTTGHKEKGPHITAMVAFSIHSHQQIDHPDKKLPQKCQS
jgi:hypothetical protein